MCTQSSWGQTFYFLNYFFKYWKIVYYLIEYYQIYSTQFKGKKNTKSTYLTWVLNCFVLYILVFWSNGIWGNVLIVLHRRSLRESTLQGE